MVDNKLTDKQIIKALECCVKDDFLCDGRCAGQMIDCDTKHACRLSLLKKSLDLINRQKAENEYLQKEYIPEIARATKRTDELAFEEMRKTARLQEENERYKHSIRLLEKDVQTAKSEAVKEFAERLKEKFAPLPPQHLICGYNVFSLLDNLVKEMAGE